CRPCPWRRRGGEDLVEDTPAVQEAWTPLGAWVAVGHAPMNRTGRSRLNNRLHQDPLRLRRRRHPPTQLQPLRRVQPCNPRFCNAIRCWLVSQPASRDHGLAICSSEQRTAALVPQKPVRRPAKLTKAPAPLASSSFSCSWGQEPAITS